MFNAQSIFALACILLLSQSRTASAAPFGVFKLDGVDVHLRIEGPERTIFEGVVRTRPHSMLAGPGESLECGQMKARPAYFDSLDTVPGLYEADPDSSRDQIFWPTVLNLLETASRVSSGPKFRPIDPSLPDVSSGFVYETVPSVNGEHLFLSRIISSVDGRTSEVNEEWTVMRNYRTNPLYPSSVGCDRPIFADDHILISTLPEAVQADDSMSGYGHLSYLFAFVDEGDPYTSRELLSTEALVSLSAVASGRDDPLQIRIVDGRTGWLTYDATIQVIERPQGSRFGDKDYEGSQQKTKGDGTLRLRFDVPGTYRFKTSAERSVRSNEIKVFVKA